jgi:hypothetical protein
MADQTIAIESDWLPQGELDRLLSAVGRDEPGVSTAPADDDGERSFDVDPAVAVALITGAVSLVVPFVTKVAERVFAKEPATTVAMATNRGEAFTINASLPPEVQERIIREAIEAGAVTVRISLEPISS